MSNHVNRFYTAVTVLAGHGHIKQRLIEAFEQNLAEIDDAALPLAVKESFAELRQTMSQVEPLNGEGAICASVRKMSIDEADGCAHRIIDLFGDIIRHSDDDQDALSGTVDDQTQVPPFLVKAN